MPRTSRREAGPLESWSAIHCAGLSVRDCHVELVRSSALLECRHDVRLKRDERKAESEMKLHVCSPHASCTRQQRTAAANFFSLGCVCVEEFFNCVLPVGVLQILAQCRTFPQRRIRLVILLHVQNFHLCELHVPSEARPQKQMLLRSETSHAFAAKTCADQEKLFKIIFAPCRICNSS